MTENSDIPWQGLCKPYLWEINITGKGHVKHLGLCKELLLPADWAAPQGGGRPLLRWLSSSATSCLFTYFWHAINPAYSRNISVQRHLSCMEMHVMEKKRMLGPFPLFCFLQC